MKSNPSNQSEKLSLKYRTDIEGLRALAVVPLLLFHAFPEAVPGGFIGVDIFFVISGFLISKILFSNLGVNKFSFIDFYTRRINRIFPALFIVLIFCILLGWFVLLPNEYTQLGLSVSTGSIFISNFLFWNQIGYFDAAAELKPLLNLWSLGVEAQFYLVWPLILWVAWRIKLNLLMITVTVVFLSFSINVYYLNVDMVAAYYLPNSRFWELLSGGLLAWISLNSSCNNFFVNTHKNLSLILGRISSIRYSKFIEFLYFNFFSFLGILLLVFGFFLIDKNSRFPGYWALLPVIGTVLVIAAGPNSFFNKKLLSTRAFLWFGVISYPLFLWHTPILAFARIMEGEIPSPGIRLIAVLVSVLLALLTHLLIENPIRTYLSNKILAIVFSILVAFAGCLGIGIYQNKGLPSRAGIEQLASTQSQFVYSQDRRRFTNSKVAVIGDSHAGHLVTGLKKELGVEYVSYYTENGCIPFYNLDSYDSRGKPGECMNLMNLNLEAVQKSNAQIIVMTSGGPSNLSNEGFLGRNDPRIIGRVMNYQGRPDLTDKLLIYEAAMRSTFDVLLNHRKKIIFVIDTPELGFEPQTCIKNRPVTLTKLPRELCAVPRKDYELRFSKYNALMSRMISAYPKVTFVNLTDKFCDIDWCYANIDGKYLYRDSDHLSDEGSLYAAKFITPAILDALE